MNLNFQIELDGKSISFQEFLFDSTQKEYYTFGNGHPIGYLREESLVRETDTWPDYRVEQNFQYMVREIYTLTIKGHAKGPAKIIVIRNQPTVIMPRFYLCYKSEIEEKEKKEVINLFAQYDPSVIKTPFKDWIYSEMTSKGMNTDNVAIETALKVIKNGPYNESPSQDELSRGIDYTAQRRWYRNLYGCKNSDGRFGTFDVEGVDYMLEKYFKEIELTPQCDMPSTELVLESNTLEETYATEVKQNDLSNPKIVEDVIERVAQKTFPPDCKQMITHNEKIATVFAFPEFKLEWKPSRVKIGCVEITIYLPIISMRISRIVLYVYYSWPADKGATLVGVIRPCAISSAAKGTIVGVVMVNPGAAVLEFLDSFYKCIALEYLKCVNPGIHLLKEVTNWQ